MSVVPILLAGWRPYVPGIPVLAALPAAAPRPKRVRNPQRSGRQQACPECFVVFFARKGQQTCSHACSSRMRAK